MKNTAKHVVIGLLMVGMIFGNGLFLVSPLNSAQARIEGSSEVQPIPNTNKPKPAPVDNGSNGGGSTGGGTSGGETKTTVDQAVFNNHPNDYPTLRVCNIDRDGENNTSCWDLNKPVKDGELVSFNMYYHNTSYTTALNTRVKLSFNYNYASQKI